MACLSALVPGGVGDAASTAEVSVAASTVGVLIVGFADAGFPDADSIIAVSAVAEGSAIGLEQVSEVA
jgi:hypothetical protein